MTNTVGSKRVRAILCSTALVIYFLLGCAALVELVGHIRLVSAAAAQAPSSESIAVAVEPTRSQR